MKNKINVKAYYEKLRELLVKNGYNFIPEFDVKVKNNSPKEVCIWLGNKIDFKKANEQIREIMTDLYYNLR